MIPNFYFNPLNLSNKDIIQGKHRQIVGGKWEEYGKLYLNILKKYGLTSQNKVLDIGCGCFRGGIELIKYLDPFNYYGIEVNKELIEIGLNYEIPNYNLQNKVGKKNFLITNNFNLEDFNVKFDMAIAQSIFTHLPLNYLFYFLVKVSKFFVENSKLIISFWICPEDKNIIDPIIYNFDDGELKTQHLKPHFHYKLSQIINLISHPDISINWNYKILNDIHPRQQKFILFTKKI
tara:strand:+ start:1724 stop:2425 length:702 start_codon:yes stop_codon:yes gene_type:complete